MGGYAASYGQTEAMRALVESKAAVDARDVSGRKGRGRQGPGEGGQQGWEWGGARGCEAATGGDGCDGGERGGAATGEDDGCGVCVC